MLKHGLPEAAEKVALWRRSVPQRLKPHCKQGSCGTGKPVHLSKTDFFSTLYQPGPVTKATTPIRQFIV